VTCFDIEEISIRSFYRVIFV